MFATIPNISRVLGHVLIVASASSSTPGLHAVLKFIELYKALGWEGP